MSSSIDSVTTTTANDEAIARALAWQEQEAADAELARRMQSSTPYSPASSSSVSSSSLVDFNDPRLASNSRLEPSELERRAGISSRQASVVKSSDRLLHIALTNHGRAALEEAAEAANSDQQFANDAPEEERNAGLRWEGYGGGAIDDLLHRTPLITIQYLIALAKAGGIFPRAQDVPAAAKITPSNA